MSTCPVCTADQPEGLLCHNDTTRLETALGEVPWLVEQLTITISKQAKIGGNAGKGTLASEKNNVDWDASDVATDLMDKLTGWARDVSGDRWDPQLDPQRADTNRQRQTLSAAAYLLDVVNEVRKHPAVLELVEEIQHSIECARYVVMGPANRTIIFVGPCPELRADGTTCRSEVHAYIPRQDDRPGRMQCRNVLEHRWSSEQWLRAGRRIAILRDQIAAEKRSAA